MTEGVKDRLIRMIADMSEEEVQGFLQRLEDEEKVKEKRRHARIPYLVSIEYAREEGGGRAELRDISVGGVFLEILPAQGPAPPLVVGRKITVSIPRSGGRERLQLPGTIVRATRTGIGVAFD